MENLREKIKQAVADGVTTYKALAEALGRNHAYVQQFVLRGVPRELRERDERVILAMIDGEAAQSSLFVPPQSRNKTAFAPVVTPGADLVGHRDFPIFAAAQGGNGHVIVTFDAIEYVKRPAILEGVRDAYGILLTGESMIPAYWPGDMALVHPHLHPSRDSDVVLYHVSPTNEAEAIIKRLVSFNDREWNLKQYNPALEFTESRADWMICHRVVGKYNAR